MASSRAKKRFQLCFVASYSAATSSLASAPGQSDPAGSEHIGAVCRTRGPDPARGGALDRMTTLGNPTAWLGRQDSNLCIRIRAAEPDQLPHRDAQVRVLHPGLRVSVNSNSEMQRFESRPQGGESSRIRLLNGSGPTHRHHNRGFERY
jgi:hypothetical protein